MEFLPEKEEEINLLDYWRVILKRKGVIFIFTSAVLLLVGFYTFTATPKYRATATLLIEEETSKIMSIEDEFGYVRRLSDLRFFNTQLILLESESLAEKVARKMDLLSRPEFGAGKKEKKSLFTVMKDFVTFKWIAPKKSSKDEDLDELVLSDPYLDIVEELRGNIEVSPIRETKAVKVSCTLPFPVLAAGIVNTLVEEFITFSIDKRYETTQQASDFLSEQIANLRKDLASKEREIQGYGQEKELFYLSESESIAISKFADLNDAYTQFQIDRIKKEAAYRELKNLNVDSLPSFVDNTLIQELKTEYTMMKNEFEENSKVFKPGYPKMIQLKAKLDSMRNELKSEIRKAVDAAQSEYQSSLKNESSIKKLLNGQKDNVAKMDSNAIYYNSLKIEVENKRKLFNSLVERQNQTLVSARLEGLKTSYVSVIDKAKVPDKPVYPKKKLNLLLAFLIGILGGVFLCFFVEYSDNTVKGPEDVERLAHLPSLGVIPFLIPEGKKKKKPRYYSIHESPYRKENQGSKETVPEIKEIELVNYLHPKFIVSEDYRTVRTSIMLSYAERPPKTIVFSSALPQEGKTVTLANMAVSFSQLRKKVLVVDADLRKPRLHQIFNVKNVKGLTAYLTGKTQLKDIVHKTSIENIWLIPSGPIPPNPSELLNSKKMKTMIEELKKKNDFVLIDSPPVLAVVDPLIISLLADGVVLVIQPEKTEREPFLKAVEELKRDKAKIIGVLFNKANLKSKYYYNYKYEYRNYYRESAGL